MNRNRISAWSAAAVVAASLVSTAAVAQTRCATPELPGERMACEKAQQGPTELRRFIERTRMIYLLQFSDYMSDAELDKRAAQRQAQATDTTRVASTK
jgi:hypothetical protein